MFDARWRVHELDGAPPVGATGADGTGDDAPSPALVAVVVESEAPTPREVRIAPQVEGSVHPPRRQGMPEAGWTDGRFEGVVPPDGRLAAGFAAVDPGDPPVEVVDRGGPDDQDDDPSPTDLLRALGDPAPPRDAVPARDGPTTTGPGPPSTAAGRPEERRGAPSPEHRPPAAVTDWLDAVDARVDGAAPAEGRRPVELAADEAALRAVAARAGALATACRRARPTGDGP